MVQCTSSDIYFEMPEKVTSENVLKHLVKTMLHQRKSCSQNKLIQEVAKALDRDSSEVTSRVRKNLNAGKGMLFELEEGKSRNEKNWKLIWIRPYYYCRIVGLKQYCEELPNSKKSKASPIYEALSKSEELSGIIESDQQFALSKRVPKELRALRSRTYSDFDQLLLNPEFPSLDPDYVPVQLLRYVIKALANNPDLLGKFDREEISRILQLASTTKIEDDPFSQQFVKILKDANSGSVS